MTAFLTQPRAEWRNFHVVYLALTLNFVIPGLVYAFLPDVALEQFLEVNRIVGGEARAFPAEDNLVWRFLAAGNVVTLGVMCALLLYDVRRFFVVLVPLVFMKAFVATCWMGCFVLDPGFRFYLVASLFDFVTVGAFLFFAIKARAAQEQTAPDLLVPRPRS